MKLAQLADEAELFYRERRDHLRQLEDAIASGKSKRPASDLESRRSRLPAAKAVARALKHLVHHSNALPPDVVALIEKDEA